MGHKSDCPHAQPVDRRAESLHKKFRKTTVDPSHGGLGAGASSTTGAGGSVPRLSLEQCGEAGVRNSGLDSLAALQRRAAPTPSLHPGAQIEAPPRKQPRVRTSHATLEGVSSSAKQKMRTALELGDLAVRMMRQNLRRRSPGASDEEIEAALQTWVRTRPGAEHGDCDGRPVPPART